MRGINTSGETVLTTDIPLWMSRQVIVDHAITDADSYRIYTSVGQLLIEHKLSVTTPNIAIKDVLNNNGVYELVIVHNSEVTEVEHFIYTKP